MENNLISVIIPVYNVEKYVSECLDSVLGQTYGNTEIICVDDKSTDGSRKILEEYAQKSEKIKVVDSLDKGPGGARNTGLSVAKGEYIAFIDADDTVEKNYFERLYSEMTDDVDIVECGYERSGKYNSIGKRKEFIFDEQFSFFDKGFFGSVCVKLFRRSVLKDGGGEPLEFMRSLKMGEDTLFSIITTINARKIVCIPDCLYHYRVTENSLTNQKEYFNEFTKLEAFEHIIREVKNTGLQGPLVSVLTKYFFFLKDMYENMQADRLKYRTQLRGISRKVRKNRKAIRRMKFGKKVNFQFFKIALGWRI